MTDSDPVLGIPWPPDGPILIPTADGRQIKLEGFEKGVRYTAPSGAVWDLAHVALDPNDPEVLLVAGRPFRPV